MSTKKKNVEVENKLENQTIKLFEVLEALDNKDYSYYKRLTESQQKSISFYMLLQWMSCIRGDGNLHAYYLRSVDYHANIHMFNETVQQHPELCWLMLCASSPGKGKQFHAWIPQLSSRVTALKERATLKEVNEYLSKTYTNADPKTVNEMASEWTENQNRSHYIAKNCPNLKLDDIATLSAIISDHEIEEHRNDTTF